MNPLISPCSLPGSSPAGAHVRNNSAFAQQQHSSASRTSNRHALRHSSSPANTKPSSHHSDKLISPDVSSLECEGTSGAPQTDHQEGFLRTTYPSVPQNEPGFRCFEHGCGGRSFSNVENYYRHIREQRGVGKVTCPYCDKEFSRKSNREAHIGSGRCKTLSEWIHALEDDVQNGQHTKATGGSDRTMDENWMEAYYSNQQLNWP